jgi:hypothetical protein
MADAAAGAAAHCARRRGLSAADGRIVQADEAQVGAWECGGSFCVLPLAQLGETQSAPQLRQSARESYHAIHARARPSGLLAPLRPLNFGTA